jgi:hypothetical protein
VNSDTGASGARPEVTGELLDRELIRLYVLHLARGETLPVFKEVLLELTLGRRPMTTWAFAAMSPMNSSWGWMY